MKNASASGSSKSQMFPSLLSVSFFKVLPLSQKCNVTAFTASVSSFRFHVLAFTSAVLLVGAQTYFCPKGAVL